MNDSWNDELISAYLDGELTADEQVQVEQALATDARLRQMHDDLRALRQSLQALPQRKLGDDFAARVLLAAQQAQAAQSTPALAPVAAAPETPAPAPHADRHHHLAVVPAHPTEPTAWHVMVWTIAGMAAALLLVLLWPNPLAEVAVRTPTPDAMAPRPVDKPSAAGDHSPMQEAAPATMMMREAQPVEMKRQAATEEQQFTPADADQVASPAAELRMNKALNAPDAGNRALKAPPIPRNMAAPREQANPAQAQDQPTMDAARSLPNDRNKRFNGAERRNKLLAPATAAALERAGANDVKQQAFAGPEDRLVIVHVKVPAAALRGRKIDATLSESGIALATDRPIDGFTIKKAEAAEGLGGPEKERLSTIAEQPLGESELEQRLQQFDGRSLKRDTQEATAEQVDVVYVEASAEQLTRMLQDLESQQGYQVTLANNASTTEQLPGFGGMGGGGVGAFSAAGSPAPPPSAGIEAKRGAAPPPPPAPAPAIATAPNDQPAQPVPQPLADNVAGDVRAAGSTPLTQNLPATDVPPAGFAQRVPLPTFRKQLADQGQNEKQAAKPGIAVTPTPLIAGADKPLPNQGVGDLAEPALPKTDLQANVAPMAALAEGTAPAPAPAKVRILLVIQADKE
jgi:anti-sigma factor RsiW